MASAMKVIAQLPLSYELASGGTTHSPLTYVSVGGLEPARFVLDTGSDVHLFNEDLADELGLDKQPGEEGTDHSGATMPSWSVGDVPAAMGNVPLLLRDVIAIPAPPPFPGFGIRGILSPQHLHPTAIAVMDMANDELLLVEASDEEVLDFLRDRLPGIEVQRLGRDPDSGAVVVRAGIEGYPEVRAVLDTGGKETEFTVSAVPGLIAREMQRLGAGVSGGGYEGGFVGPHTLLLGGARLSVPDLAVREQIHDVDAIVSMDALRGTVIAAAADLARPVFLAKAD
ncbi:MAG TPA: aspartyl protease family protein [Candidatus Limnocylindrales bacterium]|nr:aspartyl protease family protein [Candidatus Limnocylindrales bacterium]